MRCDFCGTPDPDPSHRYPAAPFRVQTGLVPGADLIEGFFHLDSDGDFLACARCSAMIEADEWDALVKRNATKLAKRYGIDRQAALDWTRGFYEEFRRARLG